MISFNIRVIPSSTSIKAYSKPNKSDPEEADKTFQLFAKHGAHRKSLS